MRLADFINANMEPILQEWESFARSITPDPTMDKLALRDHAEHILRAIAVDIETLHSEAKQEQRLRNEKTSDWTTRVVDTASKLHADTRMESGFDMIEMVSEYRALRRSVTLLWQQQKPVPDESDSEDLQRFNESIDQSMTAAISRYTELMERSRQIFLAILGHDLRSPLYAVNMHTQVLSSRSKLDAATTDTVENIAKSVRAMDGIVTDLLEFAGGQLGAAMPIRRAKTDLKALCQEVIDETRTAFPKCGFTYKPSRDDLTGKWDFSRLRQMVSNLLSNAAQHGDGEVELAVKGEDTHILLTVHNGGPPVAPNMLSKVFNPLVRHQTDLNTTRRLGSLGLGLYIVHEIVIGHGGTIDVESSEKSGTLFKIRLPRQELEH